MVVLDKNNFEEEVLKSEGLVLVDFWSPSCEPCKALMPHVVELSEKYQENLKFAKLDTSQARRLAIKQRVMGLPTVALYKDGEKIAELTKEDAKVDAIEALIKENI